jgi:hypothetical protein
MSVGLGRLAGPSRRAASRPALVAAHHLAPGEVIEFVLACRYLGAEAVAVLTAQRLLLVNAREWKPEITEIVDLRGMQVEGWVDRRAATIRLTLGRDVHVIDRIPDTDLAGQFTSTLRARAG